MLRKTILITFNFNLLLQTCPFSPQFSSCTYRVDTFKKSSDQKLPRDQKNDQIFCVLLFLLILIETLGSDILNGGTLSYSEVLHAMYCLKSTLAAGTSRPPIYGRTICIICAFFPDELIYAFCTCVSKVKFIPL